MSLGLGENIDYNCSCNTICYSNINSLFFFLKNVGTYMKLPEEILTFMPQNSFTMLNNIKTF